MLKYLYYLKPDPLILIPNHSFSIHFVPSAVLHSLRPLRSFSTHFVPSTRSCYSLRPLHVFFTHSFLHSSQSPSNAADSILSHPQRLLTINLQRKRSIYNESATNRTTDKVIATTPFESRLTLSISQSYIVNILYQFLSNN